ncbi:MAG: RluA family pseudouridine synthase [[Clostridium] fimetarium]|nr:RluA family pseudouridine synthase [Alistipes timonensis]MCM1406034.1 RluA family pseudouridine synthase [[Clostridium] fimetarium]
MKRYTAKPGAEKRPFRPDTILSFSPTADTPLLEFLFQAMPDRKRTSVKELLKYGQVMVNGEVQRQFDLPLEAGSQVMVNLTRPFVTFYDRRLKLVYEDDDIIVVNKGYGLLSMGNDKIKEGTAYSILRKYLKTKDPRNKLFIVHRLDQHTSGLMLFAKSEQAKNTMQHNWNNMVLKRQYVCVVEGKLEPAEGEVKSYLAENSQHIVYSTDNPDLGQLAYTRYQAVKQANGYTLVEVELETGRKNQIRVHMKDLGHPIAGDRKYGAKTSPIHRLCLHARTLRFVHPSTRKLMDFSTPVPAAFVKCVTRG